MKQLLTFLLILLLTGCGTKKFYTLGDNLPIQNTHPFSQSIDVVKVKVPNYLKEQKIVRQITPYEIELIDKADWLIPMEKRLTEMLIDYLQQSMNNPNIHLYPWESDNKATLRVSVDIKKFIASNKEVTLKANYKIVNLTTKATQLKKFETKVPNDVTMKSMMKAMERAYFELMQEVEQTILNNKGV